MGAVRLSPRLLHQWHRELNALVFNGELDRPVLVVGNCGEDVIGLCWGTRIMVQRGLDETLARETLLHEMVHQWQNQNDLEMDHGPTFEQWRAVCLSLTNLSL